MTKTAIVNGALALLGQNPVIDIDAAGDLNVLMRNTYDRVLEDMLRSHSWNFAIEYASLLQLTDESNNEYDYVFQKPADCLKVLWSDATCGHELKGDQILTNNSSLYIKYIKKITDTEQFDSSFSNLLSIRLARELAFSITGEASVADRIEALYKEAKREAKKNDGQESKPKLFRNDAYNYRMRGSINGITYNIPSSAQTPL